MVPVPKLELIGSMLIDRQAPAQQYYSVPVPAIAQARGIADRAAPSPQKSISSLAVLFYSDHDVGLWNSILNAPLYWLELERNSLGG